MRERIGSLKRFSIKIEKSLSLSHTKLLADKQDRSAEEEEEEEEEKKKERRKTKNKKQKK